MNAQEQALPSASKKRYPEIDLARGLTVFLMPAVHVTMLYGNEAVYHSWLGIAMNWIAEFPGAQLFMLLMGMTLGFSDGRDIKKTFFKALKWMLAGYLLNGCKFLVPAFAGWLPTGFYQYLSITPGFHGWLTLFLLGDILQFAALSIMIMHLADKYLPGKWAILLLLVFIIICSPVVWRLQIGSGWVNELISLVTGNDPLVFFPVFPWLLYPLTGSVIGKMLRRRQLNYVWLAAAGFLLMCPGIFLDHMNLIANNENLYRSFPLQTLFHAGFCFLWLSGCFVISKITSQFIFFKILSWCSAHITLIYCIQWVIIFWCIDFIPYRGLNTYDTMLYCYVLSIIVLITARAWQQILQHSNRLTPDGTNYL